MSLIAIDSDQIAKLRKYAEEHPFTFENFKNMYHKKEKVAGDRKEYYIFIPIDCKLVFSIEWFCNMEQTEKYMCRRMSVSANKGTRFPPFQALEYIASLLGFSSLTPDKVQIRIMDKDPIPNIDILEILKTEKMLNSEKFAI